MPTVWETPRLILRPFHSRDVEGLYEMDSNPAVLTYLLTPPQNSIAQSQDTLNHIQKQYAALGIGRLAIVLKKNKEFIGWAGLKYITEPVNEQVNFYDLGYRLIQRFWEKAMPRKQRKGAWNMVFKP